MKMLIVAILAALAACTIVVVLIACTASPSDSTRIKTQPDQSVCDLDPYDVPPCPHESRWADDLFCDGDELKGWTRRVLEQQKEAGCGK